MASCLKSPKAPKAPDPYQVADAQTQANIKTAQNETALNRFDVNNPFGSVSWSVDPNDPNKYTSTTQFGPEVQQLLANANRTLQGNMPAMPGQESLNAMRAGADKFFPNFDNVLQGTEQNALDSTKVYGSALDRLKSIYGTNFNYDNAPAMPTASEGTRQSIADAIYNQSASRLDPRFSQDASDMEAKLAAQGITHGSDAYTRELDNFNRSKNDAYTSADNTAQMSSIDAMQKMFGMGLDARQQGVNEANFIRTLPTQEALAAGQLASTGVNNFNATAAGKDTSTATKQALIGDYFNQDSAAAANGLVGRDQSLNELMKIYSMMGLQPGVGGAGSVAPTPLADSVYNSYQGDLNNYNTKVGSRNNLISGGAGIAAAGLMAF